MVGDRDHVTGTSGPGIVLGQRLGPYRGRLDADLIRRYADATADPNRAPRAGLAVPPVAVVTQIWEAQMAAFTSFLPHEVRSSMTGGVHGEHDVVLHRPIVPGEELLTYVEGHGSRRGGRHNLVTMRYETFGEDGTLVAEQWWTTVLLGGAGEPVGDRAPGQAFPEEARDRHVGDYRVAVDEEMPRRYAEVSGDWSAHHFEVDAARQSGVERPFLHGLCTLALCAQGAVALVADGDPARVRRIGGRFASPTLVGEEVKVSVHRVDARSVAFEAESLGTPVVRNGILELRA